VEDIFASAVMKYPEFDESTKLAVVRAVNKVSSPISARTSKKALKNRSQMTDFVIPFVDVGALFVSVIHSLRWSR
jgi:hypothetical protein